MIFRDCFDLLSLVLQYFLKLVAIAFLLFLHVHLIFIPFLELLLQFLYLLPLPILDLLQLHLCLFSKLRLDIFEFLIVTPKQFIILPLFLYFLLFLLNNSRYLFFFAFGHIFDLILLLRH